MRFSNLQDWLTWQESLHPAEIELGLDRVSSVLQRMALGQPAFTVISVAGTNGKGSCAAMLDTVYRAAGYKVGMYTSPHIKHYNERICINGQQVSDAALCDAFELVDQSRGGISLTYFEFGTLAAIALFQQANLDIAILEVGLGGRLDAVNILEADVAVITSIDLDHQDWLGDSRDAIAREKAGIARRDHPTVCGDPDPPPALLAYLQHIHSPLYLLNRDFHYQAGDLQTWHWETRQHKRHNLPQPSLWGGFQLLNAATVLMVLELLEQRWPVTQKDLHQGLANVFIAGRFQVLPGDIAIIVDIAHNRQSALALAATLQQQPCKGATYAVFGVLKDKDVAGIIDALRNSVDAWYLVELATPRAMKVKDIASLLRQQGLTQPVYCYDSVVLAKDSAIARATPQDRIVVFGSFFVASEIL